MDTLQCMRVFARVAQRSGFASAARDLRMSPAAVTKHVASLETSLGVRLLDRTSRNVALTEAGRVYLERCVACLQASEDAAESVRQLASEPRGMLRVTAPYDLQGILAPGVARFIQCNPKILVDVRYSNRTVDLVEEGYDVAVRVARALEGPFIARALCALHVVVCAAPSYLAAHGRPAKPADLSKHRFLTFAEPTVMEAIPLERNGKLELVKVSPSMISNGGDTLVHAAVAGAGITMAPRFLVNAALLAGELVQLLPEWHVAPGAKLYVLHPHKRFVPPSTRLFIDFLGREIPEMSGICADLG
jgi:DNA-binding transcriptional LysR family regulator